MAKVLAYILIVTDVGIEYEVIQKLLNIEGVTQAQTVYGEYDILLIVSWDDLNFGQVSN